MIESPLILISVKGTRTMKRSLGLFTLLTSFLVLPACAFGNRNLVLIYPPKADGVAQPVLSSPVEPLVAVVLVDFLDQRAEKTAVGAIHNGFGSHTADAITNTNVADWVMSAIALELQKARFRVIRAHSVPLDLENSVVTGEVLTAYCNMYRKYEGDVSFSVSVKYRGKEIFHKTYDGKVTYKGHGTDFGSQFAEGLSQSLGVAAKEFTAEISRDLTAAISEGKLISERTSSIGGPEFYKGVKVYTKTGLLGEVIDTAVDAVYVGLT